MAKTRIEFAFGLRSGSVVFVVASCITEALRKINDTPNSAWSDRKRMGSGVTMRLPAEHEIHTTHLIWWTVFNSTTTSYTLDGCRYPGNQHNPDRYWLVRMGCWRWGLAPTLYVASVPQHVLDAVITADGLA